VLDRRVISSVAAGFGALGAGIVAAFTDVAPLALVAGVAGFGAAIGATAIGAGLRSADDQLTERTAERDALRRELDALAAIFADEANPARADFLPLAAPPQESIVDTASGLLDEQHYKVLVTKRLAAARRALQPISIVLFEIDGLEDADRAPARSRGSAR
jgi:hypothetical protein